MGRARGFLLESNSRAASLPPTRLKMSVRKAAAKDLLEMQRCNVLNLPENYSMKYFLYHLTTWPEISFVAEWDAKIVGYVMCKIDSEEDPFAPPGRLPTKHGHVTSLSVLRPFRRLYLAEQLMKQAEQSIRQFYPEVKFITLHVRMSNTAALGLYEKNLGFVRKEIERKYYGNGEDAQQMVKSLYE